MRHEILIVGRGGQGVLLLGRLIGLVASKYMNYYTSGTEHYASETRGGESRVDMVIADSLEEAFNFVSVTNPHIMILLYPYNLDSYLKLAQRETFVFLDKTFHQGEVRTEAKLYAHEYTRLAEKLLNNPRVANMLLLGHVVKVTNLLPLDYVKMGIAELLDKRYHEANFKALEAGFNLPA